ncbi:MAG: LysR family transcriptional regulator [Burkholderiaceae bacterium]
MDRWSAMQSFARVVESGSFVAAAERLGTSTSSLSRQISELEQHLGARLLNRTTRRLSLTESGQAFYERTVSLLGDLAEAEAIVGQSAVAPRGTLRLTCSHNMAEKQVAPAIAAFVERYPEMKFDLVASDRLVDLVDEGFDLAIRVGSVGSDRLVARRLGSTQLIACASENYLEQHGGPTVPADLSTHNVLTYAYASVPRSWRFTDSTGQQHDVRVTGSLHANSGDALKAAAIAGLGIICEPDFMVADAIGQGRLKRILPGFDAVRGDIWAVYPSRRHLSLKVRLFVDHIAQRFDSGAPAS